MTLETRYVLLEVDPVDDDGLINYGYDEGLTEEGMLRMLADRLGYELKEVQL